MKKSDTSEEMFYMSDIEEENVSQKKPSTKCSLQSVKPLDISSRKKQNYNSK